MKSIKYKVFSIKFSAVFSVIFLYTLYSILYTPLAFAAVDISKEYAFGDLTSLAKAIDRLVLPAFSIAATAVVIYFVYAAFKYTTSGGDKEALAEAQKMVTHSIIGFVLLMLLFFFIDFIFGRLFGIDIELFKGIKP